MRGLRLHARLRLLLRVGSVYDVDPPRARLFLLTPTFLSSPPSLLTRPRRLLSKATARDAAVVSLQAELTLAGERAAEAERSLQRERDALELVSAKTAQPRKYYLDTLRNRDAEVLAAERSAAQLRVNSTAAAKALELARTRIATLEVRSPRARRERSYSSSGSRRVSSGFRSPASFRSHHSSPPPPALLLSSSLRADGAPGCPRLPPRRGRLARAGGEAAPR